jgi:hypothetical protein
MGEKSADSQESVKPGDHGRIGFGRVEYPKIVDGVVATLARAFINQGCQNLTIGS